DTTARLLLGRARHALSTIVQRNNHDYNRPRQRWLVDVPARARPRLRRERRHDRYRLASRTYWRSRLAYGGRTSHGLRRRADQAFGQRTRIRSGCRARWFRTCAFWADDSPAGNGWDGRAIAPSGPAGGSRRSRCRMVAGDARRAGVGRGRTGDDRSHAVVNGGYRGDAVGLLRRRGWT